ncbi:IclR family transcriptional regulator [Azospirillum sp. RWY-5-1]|uniref:IclR family transcriptional regulator n=1 Tax=Azospirillum oleiclasticum TaxID=2735135 RepID=A0ABX2TJ21_9PROT|nr:IclR family transcriptional regulator [Azospirillum oleiclasticum]NYZ14566.1 IclR family transcriptional regulator [Azospirillum oleiclasticum]NYZ24344.1 IclR family transcriptional regulator [Azospirillum oleiclasticum]
MSVRQAANVLELLEYFSQRRRPATLAEIADDLGWPRSSTFNLIGTIVEKGYLYEPRPRAGYYPTPRWLKLVQTITDAEPLPEAAHRLVVEIAAETGETTAIAALSGVSAMFLDVAESTHSVRYHAQIGDRVPAHASSAGRAILAQLAPEARQALYRKLAFERYSETTPMTVDAIESELRLAEERGYHQSHSEYIPDLAGVSFPLRIGDRRLSVVVAGPVSRCLDRRPRIAQTMRSAITSHEAGLAAGQPVRID